MGSGFLGIHLPCFILEGCNPGAMKTPFGAHQQFGLDGESTESVKARCDRPERPISPPEHWSKNMRRAVGFVAK